MQPPAPGTSNHSLLDAYIVMLEKSPAQTILYSAIALGLVLLLLIFMVLASSQGLRNLLRDLTRGVRFTEGKFAYDGTSQSDDKTVQTDEKGNVKPPPKSSETETQTQATPSDRDPISWFVKMEYAYREEGDCLATAANYYRMLKESPGSFPLPFIESVYMLSRFRCGDSSALASLKAQSGPTTEAYYANDILAEYYQSIGDGDAARICVRHQFEHAPDGSRKLRCALLLGEMLADANKVDEGIAFIKSQLSYFLEASERAEIYESLGKIYGQEKLNWRKQLCFEKSLSLNADNTKLRFSLGYSYGESGYGTAMAAHHYRILREQTPRDSTVANNLSVIYDESGAVSRKISLLREAQRRKDSAYVGANLATAYAKAGFIADARECLKPIPADEQQEGIVQTAHQTIKDQQENDKQIIDKLDRLIAIEKRLVQTKALNQLTESDTELQTKFVGDWQIDKGTVLEVSEKEGELVGAMTVENEYYEHASYKVTVQYEVGLLQLDAALDEASLRDRPTSQPTGLATSNLLTGFGSLGGPYSSMERSLFAKFAHRPKARIKLILVPGEPGSLHGMKMTSDSAKQDDDDQQKLMLNAEEVHLTKRETTAPA
jgi:hypothetical protein